ncbi:MAG: hypothetical protein JW779_16330 [Candidatus Thorarchaeota archaeon]|nr:hypothetical protein [Candidatus Thorarchaeota archaeon]
MKGILVLDDAGLTIAAVGLEEVSLNTELFSAFISAIQTYALRSIGTEMKSLTYSQVILMIGQAGDKIVVTLHSLDDPDSDWNHRATLRIMEGDGFRLDDQYLGILRELLTEGRLSPDEAKLVTTS